MTNLNKQETWNQLKLGIDNRILKAIGKIGFSHPTLVQSRCIPVALQGRDILGKVIIHKSKLSFFFYYLRVCDIVKSRTGSGKTIAFAVPVLNKLLIEKESDAGQTQGNKVRSIILAPTKELCKQIEKQIDNLLCFCRDQISLCCLSEDNTNVTQFRLQRKPDILISTPTRIAQYIRLGHIDLSYLKVLIIDEADIILSFGYSDDLSYITSQLPKIFQGILVSATLSPQLETNNLQQYFLECTEKDKYLIFYVFVKLGLLQVKYY
jgi:ATP-dependent RNA helicase DDX56/DBP9